MFQPTGGAFKSTHADSGKRFYLFIFINVSLCSFREVVRRRSFRPKKIVMKTHLALLYFYKNACSGQSVSEQHRQTFLVVVLLQCETSCV